MERYLRNLKELNHMWRNKMSLFPFAGINCFIWIFWCFFLPFQSLAWSVIAFEVCIPEHPSAMAPCLTLQTFSGLSTHEIFSLMFAILLRCRLSVFLFKNKLWNINRISPHLSYYIFFLIHTLSAPCLQKTHLLSRLLIPFWDYPSDPVAKTLCSQVREPGFNPRSGN